MELIYQNIRKIRAIKGFSQQNMVDELSMSQRNYGRIENGDVDATYSILNKIAEILQVKLVHLLGTEEMLIYNNNYNQPQQDGHFNAYIATDIEQVSKLYERIIIEKDEVILALKENIAVYKKIKK